MDETRTRVHLIEKKNYFNKLSDREYESGWWSVDDETAKSLVGALILFHETRQTPSFFGGEVLGFRLETEGDHKDRVIFRFEISNACKGIKAGPKGWSLEKKIVRGV